MIFFLKMNSQEVTLLVTRDLSATFDTVNHGILIDRLNKDVGIQKPLTGSSLILQTEVNKYFSMEQSQSNLT